MVLCDPSCAVPVSVRVLKLNFPCLAPQKDCLHSGVLRNRNENTHSTCHLLFSPGKKSYFVLWLFSLVIVVSDRFSPTHLGGKHEKMALFRTYACGAEIYICIYIHKNIFRLRICPAIQRVKLRMKEMSCWHLKHLNSIFCCHNTFA